MENGIVMPLVEFTKGLRIHFGALHQPLLLSGGAVTLLAQYPAPRLMRTTPEMATDLAGFIHTTEF